MKHKPLTLVLKNVFFLGGGKLKLNIRKRGVIDKIVLKKNQKSLHLRQKNDKNVFRYKTIT